MATLKGVHYKSLLLSAIMAGYFIHFANFFFDGFLGMFSNQMAPLQNEQWGFLFGHMFNSIFFAWVYAKYAMNRLPGPNIIKGIIYGVILYVVVMVTMMIVSAGGGTFAARMAGMTTAMMIGGLINHMVWGGFIGALYNDEHCLNKEGKKCCC